MRRNDLLRDKQNIVSAFFEYINKNPAEVRPIDVRDWLSALESRGMRPATIYQRACLLSSFYAWAMRDPELSSYIRTNPARLARSKAPKAYQTESSKSLSDDELQALISVVRKKALAGDVVAKRDYAILILFMATGMRRSEVLSLRGRDIRVEDTLVLTSKVEGDHYIGREVSDSSVKDALIDYLSTAKRLHVFKTDAPVDETRPRRPSG
jgi:integrase/recombinase XerC